MLPPTVVQLLAAGQDLEARGFFRGVVRLIFIVVIVLIVIGIVVGLMLGRLFRGRRRP